MLTSSVLVPRGRRPVVAAADHAAGLPLVGVLASPVAVARASIEKSEIRQNLFSLNWQSRAKLEKNYFRSCVLSGLRLRHCLIKFKRTSSIFLKKLFLPNSAVHFKLNCHFDQKNMQKIFTIPGCLPPPPPPCSSISMGISTTELGTIGSVLPLRLIKRRHSTPRTKITLDYLSLFTFVTAI